MSQTSRDPRILRLVVSPVNDSDDTRFKAALDQIAMQNSRLTINSREGSYILEGRTESELDSVCDCLRDEFHLTINVGAPSAILLETIRKQAEAEGKYIRQTGGSGNYGHCKLRVEPNEPGKGHEFINDIKGGAVPNKYIRPIEQGVQGAMELGILKGFQMVDIKVTLFGGSYHEVDSNEMAFKFAGSIAFKEAARKASPVLLEPMMALDIALPENLAPATRHEVHKHRGRIESSETSNGFIEMKAVVPLSELLASSSGIAVCPMEFAGYEAARDNGFSDDNGSGVTANKPSSPKPRERFEAARPEPEDK